MRSVNDNNGNPSWGFDGRFVYSNSLEEIYWICEDDVFSMPQSDDHFPSGQAPAMLVGTLSKGIATAVDGSVLFTM